MLSLVLSPLKRVDALIDHIDLVFVCRQSSGLYFLFLCNVQPRLLLIKQKTRYSTHGELMTIYSDLSHLFCRVHVCRLGFSNLISLSGVDLGGHRGDRHSGCWLLALPLAVLPLVTCFIWFEALSAQISTSWHHLRLLSESRAHFILAQARSSSP